LIRLQGPVFLGMLGRVKYPNSGAQSVFTVLFASFLVLCGLKMTAQTTVLTFTHGGLNRTAQVYVPPVAQPSDSLPLVLVLHGFTQSGTTMLNSAGFNALAQQYRAIIAYPNGVNNGWNTLSGMPGASTADDVGYLLALADSIRVRWGTRYHRLYSCGFSAGGFMSYRLACERPDRFEAIASVAGTMSNAAFAACQGPPLQPAYRVRLMHIHGTSDAVVSYSGGSGNVSADQCVQAWVSRSICPGSPVTIALPNTNTGDGSTVEQNTYSPCAPLGPVGSASAAIPGRVVFLKVQGGGHTWPGNTAPLFGLGNVNQDIAASARIMDFFLGGAATFTNDNLESIVPSNLSWQETLRVLQESSSPGDGLWDLWGRPCNPDLVPQGQIYWTRVSGIVRKWHPTEYFYLINY